MSGSRSGLVTGADVNYGQRSPSKDPIPFGRRMGANFYQDESGNGFVKPQALPIKVSGGREQAPIFKTEVLQKCDTGRESSPGIQYRKKSIKDLPIDKEPRPGSVSNAFGHGLEEEAEDDIDVVANQLKWIQNTQDNILDSLRHDIDLIQTENTILRQNNSRLQSQVSQLNQLVSDLSFDLRQMRDLISSNQKMGMNMRVPMADVDSSKRYESRTSTRRKHVPNEVSSTSTTASLEASDGSVSARSQTRRQHKSPSNAVPAANQKQSTRTKESSADAAIKRSKRSSKEVNSAPSHTPPPKKSSCFGGMFGRRKATE